MPGRRGPRDLSRLRNRRHGFTKTKKSPPRAFGSASPLALIVAALAAGTVLARRRGYIEGGDAIVKCREGHLFTTLRIPRASFKSVWLGWLRYRLCPVARHWTLVTPVRAEDLTDEQRQAAALFHDVRVP